MRRSQLLAPAKNLLTSNRAETSARQVSKLSAMVSQPDRVVLGHSTLSGNLGGCFATDLSMKSKRLHNFAIFFAKRANPALGTRFAANCRIPQACALST